MHNSYSRSWRNMSSQVSWHAVNTSQPSHHHYWNDCTAQPTKMFCKSAQHKHRNNIAKWEYKEERWIPRQANCVKSVGRRQSIFQSVIFFIFCCSYSSNRRTLGSRSWYHVLWNMKDKQGAKWLHDHLPLTNEIIQN